MHLLNTDIVLIIWHAGENSKCDYFIGTLCRFLERIKFEFCYLENVNGAVGNFSSIQ